MKIIALPRWPQCDRENVLIFSFTEREGYTYMKSLEVRPLKKYSLT